MSEDCLYLNVWTGAASARERRPVMVYFFGGGFTEGAGSVPLYDGDMLARKGAVVVTMNYRLGPYGFFVHPALTAASSHDASGNYGLMDMLASLRWVQSNIAAFGGDRFIERARDRWGDLADEYLRLYPHATDAKAAQSTAESYRDGTFWHMRLYADYQVKRGRHAYLYFFTQNPPAPAGQTPFPATHGSEVPYVFDNLGRLPLYPDRSDPELAAASVPDQELAEEMSSYWVNFARSGNPNGRGLPKWSEHELGGSDRAAILDTDPASEQLPDAARLALYDRLYERQKRDRP